MHSCDKSRSISLVPFCKYILDWMEIGTLLQGPSYLNKVFCHTKRPSSYWLALLVMVGAVKNHARPTDPQKMFTRWWQKCIIALVCVWCHFSLLTMKRPGKTEQAVSLLIAAETVLFSNDLSDGFAVIKGVLEEGVRVMLLLKNISEDKNED
ncbi:hypothetical protein ACHAW6_009558 [Cyclotella cf. meneghiniana]